MVGKFISVTHGFLKETAHSYFKHDCTLWTLRHFYCAPLERDFAKVMLSTELRRTQLACYKMSNL
jgi:hypothetical protein